MIINTNMAPHLTRGLVVLSLHICFASGSVQQPASSDVVINAASSPTSRHEALKDTSPCPHHGGRKAFCNGHLLPSDFDHLGCPDWMPELECLRMVHHPNCTFPAATCPKDLLPHCDADFLRDGIRLSRDEPCLNGPDTLVAEGFLLPQECRRIMGLNELSARGEDHRETTPSGSPDVNAWSADAKWLRAALPRSVVAREGAELIVASSSKIRRYTEAYFKLRSQLHFDQVRLECHAAPDGSYSTESYARDLVRAGICQPQPNGSCVRLESNTKWRHYSAVLFLNDDFQGGHFVLTGRSTLGTVNPKCGRSVIVTSNQPYGYLPLHRGRQCRLVLGLTHAPDHGDEDMDELLKAADEKRMHGPTTKRDSTKRDPTKRREKMAPGRSTAFFVHRLQTARPISIRSRIMLVVAAMTPILASYTAFFSYHFYNYMHPDRKLNFLKLFF
ncbi:prolyl 3-hydroxylase 3-like [Amblyomma americanum]